MKSHPQADRTIKLGLILIGQYTFITTHVSREAHIYTMYKSIKVSQGSKLLNRGVADIALQPEAEMYVER